MIRVYWFRIEHFPSNLILKFVRKFVLIHSKRSEHEWFLEENIMILLNPHAKTYDKVKAVIVPDIVYVYKPELFKVMC